MKKLIPSKKQWESWTLPSRYTAIGVLLALISLAVTLVVVFLPKPSPKITIETKTNFFGLLEGVEVKEKLIVGFLNNGAKWTESFDSRILKYAVVDLNGDENKDILLGFESKGSDHSRVIALNSYGKILWKYIKEPNYPYSGGHSGRFNVTDLKTYYHNDRQKCVVIFNDQDWYQSVMLVLDKNGQQLKEFWHPGQMHQVEFLGDIFVVKAMNNDLRQTRISKYPNKNFSVVFALKYSNIFGEAPPYYGPLPKNRKFEWYYYLSDQRFGLGELVFVENSIRVWSTCGKGFYLNKNGKLHREAIADSYSCPEDLNLSKL